MRSRPPGGVTTLYARTRRTDGAEGKLRRTRPVVHGRVRASWPKVLSPPNRFQQDAAGWCSWRVRVVVHATVACGTNNNAEITWTNSDEEIVDNVFNERSTDVKRNEYFNICSIGHRRFPRVV